MSSVTETPGCLAGFWDEPENLDRELSLFVAGMWTCLQDSCGDEMYYYNQVNFALVPLSHQGYILHPWSPPAPLCPKHVSLCEMPFRSWSCCISCWWLFCLDVCTWQVSQCCNMADLPAHAAPALTSPCVYLLGSTGSVGLVQVTGRSQWELPQSPQSIPLDDAGTFIFAEDDSHRVMPSRSAVLSAGRFDLHHGIMYNGGYRAAAAALDRPHTWPRHKVLFISTPHVALLNMQYSRVIAVPLLSLLDLLQVGIFNAFGCKQGASPTCL